MFPADAASAALEYFGIFLQDKCKIRQSMKAVRFGGCFEY